jgi:hypothetical protein
MFMHSYNILRPKEKKKRTWQLCLSLILFLLPMSANAQLLPKEVSVSYSFLQANSSGNGGAFNANGGNLTAVWMLKPRIDLLADFGGYHFGGQPGGVDGRLLTYTAGPRLSFRKESRRWTPFCQLLLGAGRVSGSSGNLTAAENGFVLLAGGGVNLRFRAHVDIHALEVNYLMTRFVRVTGTSGTQNDFRISSGLVFRLGRK